MRRKLLVWIREMKLSDGQFGKRAWAPLIMVMLLGTLLAGCWRTCPTVPRPSVATVPLATEKSPFPYRDINFNLPLWAITNPRIYVYKADRKLLLVNDDILVREYRVGLGPSPRGDKFMRGDGRTPEGQFYVCARNPDSKYYKSLGLNYPAPKHAEEALHAGFISIEQFQALLNANNNRELPPWNTPLGGAIFIHGGGAHEDWTEGCIAVYNSAIDELFEVIPVGTPVEVLP